MRPSSTTVPAFVEVSGGGGGAGTVETEDPVEGDGETATPVTLTDTAKHSLSQVPALEERTQDLVARGHLRLGRHH